MAVRISPLLLWALVGGATVNVAAGLRRPFVEHRLLASGYYEQADEAAAAVRARVPADARLTAVTYDQDLLGELDCAVWLQYRLSWLLYPRPFEVVRLRGQQFEPAPRFWIQSGEERPPPVRAGEFLLFFRVTQPPALPHRPLRVVSRGRMWVLAQAEAP